MHYKNGEEVKLGDIAQHDSGSVGIVIGGTIGSDYCSTHVVKFDSAIGGYCGSAYVGTLHDAAGKVLSTASVRVSADSHMQTREMIKIGHVDIGHG